MRRLFILLHITILAMFFSGTALKGNPVNQKNANVKDTTTTRVDSISNKELLSAKAAPAPQSDCPPMSGTTYDIISSTKTDYEDRYKACSQTQYYCKFLVETRRYTKWKDGKAEKVWMETVNVFMGCGRW